MEPTIPGPDGESTPESPLRVSVRGVEFLVRRGRNDEFWRAVGNGAWEPETYALFERFLRKDRSYLDVGAWIGPTVLYGCRLARLAVAVEPDRVAFPELAGNVSLNRPLTDNVRLVNACLDRRDGEVRFGSTGDGGDSTSSLLLHSSKTLWTVEAIALESLIARCGLDDCGFIKMDIEGGEYSVVPAARAYLRRARPTLLLSLHPGRLGNFTSRRIRHRIGRVLRRLFLTARLVFTLRFYRHAYDCRGNAVSRLGLVMRCLRGVDPSVVFTDEPWPATGGAAAEPA